MLRHDTLGVLADAASWATFAVDRNTDGRECRDDEDHGFPGFANQNCASEQDDAQDMENREQSRDRMVAEAEKFGANAIVTIRFSTSSMMQGAAELLCYGTAVWIEND